MQLCAQPSALGICGRCGKALTQLRDFFFAGTTTPYLGPAAGCGHEFTLLMGSSKNMAAGLKTGLHRKNAYLFEIS
jgi:hypothetical protein